VKRREPRSARRLSDVELLDAADEWDRRHPRPQPVGDDDGGPAWQAWRDQWHAWLHEQGVTSDEYWRLRMRRYVGRLRWKAEQEGRVWGGVDLSAWPPSESPGPTSD
jgi:hypothetical protein